MDKNGPKIIALVGKMWEKYPTVIAHTLMNMRGKRLHHSTTRTPYFSATKLKGIVTRKSDSREIRNEGLMDDRPHVPHTTIVVSMMP